MNEVYETRYTFRVSQPSNVILPIGMPSDGFLVQFIVDNRYENFYYSSAENQWNFYNIAPGPVHTNVAFYSPREKLLLESSDREYISYMLQEANIPLHAHTVIIPHIEELATSIANQPTNARPKLLPILVKITKWMFFNITPYLVEEDSAAIGNSTISDLGDYELLAQIASLSIDEIQPRLTPASKDATSEMLKKMKIETTNGIQACTICLEEFTDGLEVTQMPCKHVFHDECILQWLNNKNLCPLCRFEIPVAPSN